MSLTLQQHEVPAVARAYLLQWLPCRYMPVTTSRKHRRHGVLTTLDGLYLYIDILDSGADGAPVVEEAGEGGYAALQLS